MHVLFDLLRPIFWGSTSFSSTGWVPLKYLLWPAMISHSCNRPVPFQSSFFQCFYHNFSHIHSSLYFFIGDPCSLDTLQLLLIKSISTASSLCLSLFVISQTSDLYSNMLSTIASYILSLVCFLMLFVHRMEFNFFIAYLA